MIINRLKSRPGVIGAFTAPLNKVERGLDRLAKDVQEANWVRFRLGTSTAVGRIVSLSGDTVTVEVPDKGQLTIPVGDVLAIGRKRAEGFMLLELLFTIALTSILMGAVLAGLMHGFFVVRMNRDAKQAVQILVGKTETLRLYRLDQILEPGFLPTTFVETINGVRYDGTITVSEATTITSSYRDELRQVQIRVDWMTGGLARHRTFTTLAANNGLVGYVY
jgi:type II secretory pathway pseudopilin PulG